MKSIAFFFHFWIWFSFRQLLAHPWRSMAVLLGIAIGAAVFTSVRLAINASIESFSESVDIIAGKAEKVIVRPGERVSEQLIPQLIKHPDIKTASPFLSTYVQCPSGIDPILLIGMDPILDRPLREWRAETTPLTPPSSAWLDLLGKPYTLLIGQHLADALHLKTDSQLTLEHLGNKNTFLIAGVLAPRGLAQAEGGFVALTDISTFQEFTGIHGLVDRIDILLSSNEKPEIFRQIESILPEGVILRAASESKESGKLMIRSYQLNLSVLSFVSLFVGMFLVYSLVALNAASRRHELAVLRSIGASSRLIFFLFLAEGAFFGITGWLVAIPLGSFLVKQLLKIVSSTITSLFARVQVEHLVLDPYEILLSFCITVLISVLAVYQPAREAMKVPPKEALLMLDTRPDQTDSAKKLGYLGLLLVILVWPLSLLPGSHGIPLAGYLATFFLFCGFSLLSPLLLQLMGRTLPPLLRYIGGEPAYLGGRTIQDAGKRIAISAGALITAVALFVALAIMIHSFRRTVELWVNQSISGDIFISPKLAAINRYRDTLPQAVVSKIQDLQAPVDILPYRRFYLNHGESQYLLEAIDVDAFLKYARFLFLEGDPDEVLPRLKRGKGVLVSEVFANQTGVTVGQHFRAIVEGVDLNLPVLGVIRDYRTQGGVVNYSLPHFQEATGDGNWSGLRIHFRDRNHDTESAATGLRNELIRKLGRYQNAVEIVLGGNLRREILRIFDETFAITTILLLIALLVAALGITTTLTVLVLERTRVLHTLLAGGASRGQIRAMIFWEATLMVLAAESIGLACGFLLSYLLIFVINRQSFGWTFIYSVDWSSLLVSLPLILATALLAALPATQLAFRSSPASVLRER